MSLPEPQSLPHHGWHLLQRAPRCGVGVSGLAGLGGRVGGREELPDVGWRLLSLPSKPGGRVAFMVAVGDHLACLGLRLPLLLPLPPLAILSLPWFDSVGLVGRVD